MKALEFSARVLAVMALFLVVVFGGHGGGFLWQLLVQAGFDEFWGLLSFLLVAGSLLLLLGQWVYRRTLTAFGFAVIALGILVLSAKTEGGRLTLLSAVPFTFLALVVLILSFRPARASSSAGGTRSHTHHS